MAADKSVSEGRDGNVARMLAEREESRMWVCEEDGECGSKTDIPERRVNVGCVIADSVYGLLFLLFLIKDIFYRRCSLWM